MKLKLSAWLRTLVRGTLLITEPLVLLIMIVAFWHHSPPIRDNWVGLLGLAVPIFALRLIVYRRLFTVTPLLPLLLLFIPLSLFNFHNAPYHRADYIVLVCRPLLGIWLYLYFVEHARIFRRLDALFIATIGIAFVTGILALTASQWNSKIAALQFLVDMLPKVTYKTWLPDMLLSFNPNEIAGALAWLCPIMAGLTVYFNLTSPPNPLAHPTSPPNPLSKHGEGEEKNPTAAHGEGEEKNPSPCSGRGRGGVNLGSGMSSDGVNLGWERGRVTLLFVVFTTFVICFAGLFFGQSRFAIAGVLMALMGIVLLCMRGRGRILALIGIALILMLQVALIANILRAPTQNNTQALSLSGRDQESLSVRFEIWASSWRMMTDFPFTGAGMSMFRTAVQQPQYAIPFYIEQNSYPPHAHNEWLQMGADLGFPGLLLFSAWYIVGGWMLWRVWRSGDSAQKCLAITISGALLAHGFYGMGDAVTLWDRYTFVFWWVLGWVGAVWARHSPPVEKR